MNKSYLLVICLLSTSFVGCLDEESEDNEGPETAIYDMFESMGNNDWEAFCQSVGAEADWETREVVINQDAVDECINEDKGFFEIKFTIKEYTQELQSDTSAEEDVYYVTIVYDICSKVEEDFPEECEYDIKEDSLWMKVDGTWVDVSYLPWRNNSEATYSPTTVSLMYEKDSSNVYVVTVLAALTQEDLRDFSFFLKNETGSTYVGGNGFGEIAMQMIIGEAHGIDMAYDGYVEILQNRTDNVSNDDGSEFPVHFLDDDRDGKLSAADKFFVYGGDVGPAQDGWSLAIRYDPSSDIIGSVKFGNATENSSDNDDESSYSITTDSLEEVFNSMNEDGEYYYTEDEWVIHDISEIVEIDGMLMFGVTGKSQEDGYTCGLETWYIFPGESTFTPGQCLLSEKPNWHQDFVPSNDGALWAPNFHGNRTMFYTVPLSNEDSHEDTQSCIGMITATGTAPNLVWTDHNQPIICQIAGEDNNEDPEPPALDPAIFIDDDGRMYMVYGGAHIWITELDPETGEHISGDPLSWDNGDNGDYVHLSNGAEDDPLYTEDGEDSWAEAPYLHKEGDYYYLFVNWYSCCAGADSTYEIVVGRSESVTGPYLDESGTDMKNFGGTLVIAEESHDVIGPGHAGIFEYGTGEDTVQVFTHHYYPEDGLPWAYAHARTLTWEDGWPVVSQEQWDPMDYW